MNSSGGDRIMKRIKAIYAFLSIISVSIANAEIEKIYILKEIDDDYIIIVTQSDEQLLLEKWTPRYSPSLFEGKFFIAEMSPMWVTIYIEGRDPIKWTIEENLGYRSFPIPKESVQESGKQKEKATTQTARECYKEMIKEPTPFLGNGGEIIILDDGTIWKEISYQYLYLYEYYPTVIICPSTGKMILGKHVFLVMPVR